MQPFTIFFSSLVLLAHVALGKVKEPHAKGVDPAQPKFTFTQPFPSPLSPLIFFPSSSTGGDETTAVAWATCPININTGADPYAQQFVDTDKETCQPKFTPKNVRPDYVPCACRTIWGYPNEGLMRAQAARIGPNAECKKVFSCSAPKNMKLGTPVRSWGMFRCPDRTHPLTWEDGAFNKMHKVNSKQDFESWCAHWLQKMQ